MTGSIGLPESGIRSRRAISGVLLLDKPRGITSQAAVSRAKHLLAAAKAGHTGTLDPMADGLLPVCFGEATKFSHLLLDADKTYDATLKLGVTTTTGDLEGQVTTVANVTVHHGAAAAALTRFLGEVLQTPPMYSALKHAGKPLYKYAREGVAVERAPRRITIRSIDLVEFRDDELRIAVACSKGTYIRVLAEDIGRELGCGACLAKLLRTAVGRFRIDAAVTLDELERISLALREKLLLPVDSLVASLPRVNLDESEARRISSGQVVRGPHPDCSGLVRVYGPGHAYLGVAVAEAAGVLVPRRLMAPSGADPA
ncbi:MAG: tRNA pseudouridine(55) synthase TruB [Betaproteobacteria bacterium]|nr:tRNA pseudouridine(55) synthase TruB [Betaproteobacteria bacterium]